MIDGIRNIYFETSAVNYLFDNVFSNPEISSIETRKLQLRKERKWYISSITLLEIFLTKDEDRRYNLFDFSRCLFYDYLIPSSEELIVKYIQKGCPKFETPYELKSNSLFAKEWALACKNRDYAFQPDLDTLELYTKHLRFLGEYFIKTRKGYVLKPNLAIENAPMKLDGAFLKYIFNELLKYYNDNPSEEEKYYLNISVHVTFIILCCGIGFDKQTIENFWNKDRNIEPLERLELTVKNYPDVFFRGPISNIARMIILQSNSRTGRGLYFDSLHSIYTTYCDLYFSNDEHFLNFKKAYPNNPNLNKVLDVKDMTFFKPKL